MVSSNELRDCRGIRGPLRCQCHTHSPVSGRAVEPVILIRGAVYSAQMPFRDFNSSYCANSSMPADWNRSRDFAFPRPWLTLRAGHRRKLALCSALNPGARHLHSAWRVGALHSARFPAAFCVWGVRPGSPAARNPVRSRDGSTTLLPCWLAQHSTQHRTGVRSRAHACHTTPDRSVDRSDQTYSGDLTGQLAAGRLAGSLLAATACEMKHTSGSGVRLSFIYGVDSRRRRAIYTCTAGRPPDR